MKVSWFHLMPYRWLPADFRERYHGVWVDVPNRLYDPQRGHQLYNEYLDMLEYADEMGFDVMEALGIERPYVVGESMGGWIAAEMAALRPREIGRLALAAPIGLWRDDAPVVDLFGHMTHELVPYLFHDQSCPAAQSMLAMTSLVSDKDDRTEDQVELLIGLVRGFRTAAKFLFPIPARSREAPATHHRAHPRRLGCGRSMRRAVVRRDIPHAHPRRARGDHSGGGPTGGPRATGAVCPRGGAIRRRGMMGRIAPAH